MGLIGFLVINKIPAEILMGECHHVAEGGKHFKHRINARYVVQEVIYFQYIVSFIIWCLERIAKIRNVFMCNSSSSSVTFLIKATL